MTGPYPAVLQHFSSLPTLASSSIVVPLLSHCHSSSAHSIFFLLCFSRLSFLSVSCHPRPWVDLESSSASARQSRPRVAQRLDDATIRQVYLAALSHASEEVMTVGEQRCKRIGCSLMAGGQAVETRRGKQGQASSQLFCSLTITTLSHPRLPISTRVHSVDSQSLSCIRKRIHEASEGCTRDGSEMGSWVEAQWCAEGPSQRALSLLSQHAPCVVVAGTVAAESECSATG